MPTHTHTDTHAKPLPGIDPQERDEDNNGLQSREGLPIYASRTQGWSANIAGRTVHQFQVAKKYTRIIRTMKTPIPNT